MLVARLGPARAMDRNDEEEPLVGAVLALSASTGAMIALFDAIAGLVPLTAIPALVVLGGHAARLQRVAIVAAAVVWVRLLGLSEATGVVAPALMIVICAALLIGPGRVLDWLEARWEVHAERRRGRRDAHLAARAEADASEAAGWIEELPDPG